MNERYEKLFAQAHIEFAPGHKAVIERFAELIVRECAEVAANVVAEHEGVDFGLVEKCYKHFGVDE
jgi:hypothetical protein